MLAERELPRPGWTIVRKEQDKKTDTQTIEQWLIKLKNKQVVRIIMEPKDGKVQPPAMGQTDHVIVTVRWEKFTAKGETMQYAQTLVTASNDRGDFFNAVIYAAPRTLELEEIMFALGEI